MRQRSVHWLFALAFAASSTGDVALGQPGPPPASQEAATAPAPTTQRFPRRGGWREEPPSGEEWEAIVAFMTEHNPVRLEMLKRIEESLGGIERPIAREVRRTLGRRFRELEGMRTRGSEIYPFALKRIQLEDAILGTLRDLKAPAADKAALDGRLNEQIRASVDNALAERRMRIEQLKAAIERESKSLAEDTANADKLAQQQRKRFEGEMNAMIDFDAQTAPAAPVPPATTSTTTPAAEPSR